MNKQSLTLAEVQALHRSGHLDEAKNGYLAILSEDPHHEVALQFLGLLYADLGQFDLAQSCFESAIKVAPHDLALSLHLAAILKAKHLLDEAANLLLHVIQFHPTFPAAYNNLGTIYFSQGKWQEAIHVYQSALALQPDYVDAYYNLGLALNKASQTEEAISAYQALAELDPNHWAGRFQLGCLLMLRNQYDSAIEHFLMIEQKHPFHFETQSNLATCYLKLGWLSKADEHYHKALEIMPTDLQILFNQGVIYTQQGRIHQAVELYVRALKIAPDYDEAHHNLAVAYLSMGEKDKALFHFQEVKRLQPDNETAQHFINVLVKGETISSSPKEYIRSLFDSYADHYDSHLVRTLHYQLPALMYQMVDEKFSLKTQSLDILDLGCGTGLCGEPFKPAALSLTGVDLSAKMLALAEEKHIYDKLVQSDLLDFLSDQQQTYDLVLAAEVLVYFGDLSNLFSMVYQALKPAGLFVFNAETGKSSYQITDSGRFAHDKRYLDGLIASLGFVAVAYRLAPMRTQNQVVMMGHLYLLQKQS